MVSYGDTFTGTAVTLTGPTGATQLLTAKTTGDTVPQLAIDANGKLEWSSGSTPSDVSLSRDGSVRLHTVNTFVTEGNLQCDVAGGGLRIKEGANARSGKLTLTGATPVVVSNTSVTANTRIFLTTNVVGGTPGFMWVSAVSAGVSFSVTGTAGDTSTVAWLLIEPA